MSDDTLYGKFNEDDISVELELSGEDILCAKQHKQLLAKLPVKPIKALLEKVCQKELSAEELQKEITKYSGSILVRSTFSIGLSSPYEYGADADGNRGVSRQDYEDMEKDDVEVDRAELYLFDEDGNALGGEDFFIDLNDNANISDDGLVDYIVDKINEDPNSYVD